jgi:hypothetical protein
VKKTMAPVRKKAKHGQPKKKAPEYGKFDMEATELG